MNIVWFRSGRSISYHPGIATCRLYRYIDVVYIYILAGYPASLGTLPLPPPPSLPFVPPFCPPSLGLPGFGQNIWSVIAQNNSIPEIHFKKMMLFSRHFMPFPGVYFFTPYNSHCDPPGVGRSICLGSKPFPARAYIRMCVESWIRFIDKI